MIDKIGVKYDVVVIGGGPAGLAAAIEANKVCKKVLLLERNSVFGGILNQCIHNGFGLHIFKEELTGPDYVEKYKEMLEKTDVEALTNAMVLSVTKEKKVSFIHPKYGFVVVSAKSIVVATGCRERTRGAIGIAGSRPSGVFTAGEAQLFININGQMVGKKVIILGSGDIGLIMARRLTLEGAKVLGVYEVMPYSGGLSRNIVQCLNDFDIPLYLSHTIVKINGDTRVESVVVSKVDENRVPILGTEQLIECDTVLLSVGLIPENEINIGIGVAINNKTSTPILYDNMETSVEGVFACGNVAQVHDLVDFVSKEGVKAGASASSYARGEAINNTITVNVLSGDNILYITPSKIRIGDQSTTAELFYRVSGIFGESILQLVSGDTVLKEYKKPHLAPGEMEKITVAKDLLKELNEVTVRLVSQNKLEEFEVPKDVIDENGDKHIVCTICPRSCRLTTQIVDGSVNISGNACIRGDIYGKQEVLAPSRVVTSTVKVVGSECKRLSVKTNAPIPKDSVKEAMTLLKEVIVDKTIKRGDVIIKDILGLGVDFIATSSVL